MIAPARTPGKTPEALMRVYRHGKWTAGPARPAAFLTA
jgi:hypothetical protein